MAGQDAVNSARAFAAALDLTGIVLTKADGDARGGAALSVRQVTGKPIVFMGMGEKTEALEPFDPERMASRILGMGDVVSLVEQVQRQVDVKEAERLAKKVIKGKGFDMSDLKGQLEQLQQMGGVERAAGQAAHRGHPEGHARGAGRQGGPPPDRHHQFDDPQGAARARASSTAPAAAASPPAPGVQVQDVNRLLKQFLEMQRMMKSMKGGKLRRMLGAFKGACRRVSAKRL